MFSSVRFYLSYIALGSLFLAMCPSLPVAAQQATSDPRFELNLVGRKNAYPRGPELDNNGIAEGRPRNVFQ